FPVLLKEVVQVVLRGIPNQVADINILRHYKTFPVQQKNGTYDPQPLMNADPLGTSLTANDVRGTSPLSNVGQAAGLSWTGEDAGPYPLCQLPSHLPFSG